MRSMNIRKMDEGILDFESLFVSINIQIWRVSSSG